MSTVELKTKPLPETVTHVSVGGDVLDLVTKALYVDELSLYREYVQNSSDAINEAVEKGILASDADGQIVIEIDNLGRSIRITDNGVGISNDDFVSQLTKLGNSDKRGKNLRGFRGIGRLGGLAFAQSMTFRSRTQSVEHVYEMVWDGKKLKTAQLDPRSQEEIEGLVKDIVTVEKLDGRNWPERFFEVELNGVMRVGQDDLLNECVVRRYLSEVAPVPIDPKFPFKQELETFHAKWGIGQAYRIYVNDPEHPLTRPFEKTVHLGKDLHDEICGIEFFEVAGAEGVDAVGYLFQHSYLGSIPSSVPVGGLRARIGNIQIGDRDLFARCFPQKRFNAWTIGEIHILSNKIRPNSRRDEFESNVHYQNLEGHLVILGRQIATNCRRQSDIRNAVKRCKQLLASAETTISSYESGLFSRSRTSDKLDEIIAGLGRAVGRLPEHAHSHYDDQLQSLKDSAKAALEFDRDADSRLEKLSPAEKNLILKAADVIQKECPTPEVATNLISKILDSISTA